MKLALPDAATLFAASALGTIPFCALGLAIGYFASAQSVHAVVNLFYLPMAFCSGLWIPMPMLPDFLQTIAPAFPAYHLAQAALLILHQPAVGSFSAHIAALAAFTILFTGVAWAGHSLDESRSQSMKIALLPPDVDRGWLPYIWLVYLAFFLSQPVFTKGDPHWAATCAGIVAFLFLYFWGYWLRGIGSETAVAGLVILGCIFAPINTGASVFFIYAAGYVGELVR